MLHLSRLGFRTNFRKVQMGDKLREKVIMLYYLIYLEESVIVIFLTHHFYA